MRLKIIISVLIIFPFLAFSIQVDSLNNELINSQNNLEKGKICNAIGAYYEEVSDYEKSLSYLNKAKYLLNKDSDELINTYNLIGYNFWHKSMYDSAFYYHQKAEKLLEKFPESSYKAFTFMMLGNDYYDVGDFNKTSEYYFKALKEAQTNKDVRKINNRLSKLYFKLKDYKLSKEHVLKALRLSKNNFRDIGDSYNTLGNISLVENKTDSALINFKITYTNFYKSGDKIGQAIACINLGDTYLKIYSKQAQNNLLDSAYENYQKSYDLNSKVENQFGMIYGLYGMGDVLFEKNELDLASSNYKRALKLSKKIGAKSEISQLYNKLHLLFDQQNETDSSLFYLKKYQKLSEEIQSSEESKFLLLQESKYEAEKLVAKEKADLENQKLIEAEKSKWKNIVLILSAVAVLVLTYITYLSIKRLKIIRAKNEKINQINNKLNDKQNEIIDSITYAKRLQDTILPDVQKLDNIIGEHFVFYRPKDIVAGDFYWAEQKGDFKFFAVADCTGHGVPGAMMSILCKNALDNVIFNGEYNSAAQVLDLVNFQIQKSLKNENIDVTDGMDIAFCMIDSNNQLQYSGAFNSLFYTKNDQLQEISGDRKPIGKFDFKKSDFTNHTLKLDDVGQIYLTTDGFMDQFGGQKNKKFGYKRFRDLLIKNQNLSLKEQKSELQLVFNGWMETSRIGQVDDVCVLGVKIE